MLKKIQLVILLLSCAALTLGLGPVNLQLASLRRPNLVAVRRTENHHLSLRITIDDVEIVGYVE